MLKKLLALFLALLLCLSLAACGSDPGKDDPKTPDPPNGNENPENPPAAALKDVTLEWWELYNSTGFNTFTGVLVNPNDVSVDTSYDVVYYKEGKEVHRTEYCATFSILPGQRTLIWNNWDLPDCSEADEIRLENISVSETAYPPINGKYEYLGVQDNHAVFRFEFESDPTVADINFLLYNDNNQNDKFDKGEIAGLSTTSILEQSGEAYFDTDVSPYTDFEVFFTAY